MAYYDIRTATDAAYAHYPFFRAFKILHDCEQEIAAACRFERQAQKLTDDMLFGKTFHLRLAEHALEEAMELEANAYSEGIRGWLDIDKMRKEMPRWMEVAATNPAFLDYYAIEYFLHCNMQPTMVSVPDPENFVEGIFPTQYAWEADAEYQERCADMLVAGYSFHNDYVQGQINMIDEEAEAFQAGWEALQEEKDDDELEDVPFDGGDESEEGDDPSGPQGPIEYDAEFEGVDLDAPFGRDDKRVVDWDAMERSWQQLKQQKAERRHQLKLQDHSASFPLIGDPEMMEE